MGIPAESLLEQHPRLVIASISGYGQTGPRSNIGAFDSIAQAASGLQMLTGMPDGPPVKSGFYVADYAAALHATIGILVALRARDQNGRGQHVDIALVESILSMSATLVPGYVQAGVEPSRVGNGSIHAAPVDVYRCRDGFVQLSASTDSLFQRLAIAMGRPDLPSDARFSSNAARMANANELGAMIADWAITLSANDVAAALDDVGVPASQIKGIREVVADEQLQARSFFVEQQHPTAGAVTLAGSPIGLSATPPDPSRPAPRLGEHTLEVLEEWLGISRGEALALVQSGDAPSPAAAAEHPLPE
jgi:crotonobetainyl-CoA:carnitine CoA-transferase CaiB-like acyl-CoA transferase